VPPEADLYLFNAVPQANKYAYMHIASGNRRNGGKKDHSLSLPCEKLTGFIKNAKSTRASPHSRSERLAGMVPCL